MLRALLLAVGSTIATGCSHTAALYHGEDIYLGADCRDPAPLLNYEKERAPGHFIVLREDVTEVQSVTSRIQRNTQITVDRVTDFAYGKIDSYDPWALYSQPTSAIFVKSMSDQQIALVRCESGVVAIYANAYMRVE